MVDWNAVHAEFPINRRLIWLNSCGIAAMPAPVRVAMDAYFRTLCEDGIMALPGEAEVHKRIRKRLAALIHAEVDELTLTHNTAEGINFISHGLALAPGDDIVLLENEYPSNVYPWEHWRERGVKLRFAPLGASPEQFLTSLQATLTAHTRVVSLSAVHWCTGMPLPLVDIGRVCAERNILLVLDGSQGVGMVPLDMRAAQVGAMAFSAWKWLLGPIGVGALYVRRDLLARLRYPWKGTASVVDDEVYLPYRDTLKPGADRYVYGTPNYNDWIYFDASLSYLDGLGVAAVHARIAELTAHLAVGLRAAGFDLASDRFPGTATGILSVAHHGLDARAAVAALSAAGVVGAERLGRIRLAPHVLLVEEQLDRAVAAMAALL